MPKIQKKQIDGVGDVSAASNMTDASLIRGDGGAKSVQDSGILISDTDDMSGIKDITLTGTVDGRDVAADGTKLDGVEALADVTDVTNVAAAVDGRYLLEANNLSDLVNATTARTNLGLGALAVLSAVNNTSWSGTDLAIVNGGTGGSTSDQAIDNLITGATAKTTVEMADFVPVTDAGVGGKVTRQNLLGYKRNAFRAYRNANVSLTVGWKIVPLNAETFDQDGRFNISTFRYQPNVPGYYQMQGAMGFSGTVNAGDVYSLSIYKNGVEYSTRIFKSAGASAGYSWGVSDLVDMNGSTDYLELFVKMARTETIRGDEQETFFSGYLAVPT